MIRFVLREKRGQSSSRGAYATNRLRRTLQAEPLEVRRLLAYDFPLLNAGFESPDLDIDNSWHGAVDDWTLLGSAGTTYEVPWAESSPAPEGDQYVFGDTDNWSIIQAGPTIEANTRYILSVDLFPLTTGTTRAVVSLQDGTNPGLFADGAYHPAWEPTREDFILPDGEWTTVTVSFNSAFASPTTVGHESLVRIDGFRLAVDNVRLTVDDEVHDFYISSSSGIAGNDGFSPAEPWNNFDRLDAYLPLVPGERILLKAGDTFTDELNIRGKGTSAAPVALTKYGEGANPVIRRNDLANDIGVVWNNASHANISHVDVEHAKLGIYLRYEWTDTGSRNVTIEHCNLRDLTDPTLDAAAHNYEFAWSDAIWVGGQAWNQAELSTRLENLTIRHVTSENAAHLFGTGWYFPEVYKSRLKNLIIEDSLAINNLAGSFQLFNVDGGHIKRVHAIGGGGQDTWSGTTLGFIQDSKDFLIEDNLFSFLDRAQAADGSGMDFEGNTENVTFRGNTVHNNAGSALLILTNNGPHTNLVIEDNVFYNNARDPWNSEINSEIQGSSGSTGVIRNNGIYRGDPSINFFSPRSNWSGFNITGNREREYSSVRFRPTWWDFDTSDDLEGWSGFNDWANSRVVEGKLLGQSSGADPYVLSPPTWADSTTTRYAWVRMSQTAGASAQLFYVTESDPIWNEEKSAVFSISPDGNMHDYFVDLDTAGGNGVITQIRLDPTDASGSEMAVDFVRLTESNDPNQLPPTPPLPDPSIAVFTSVAPEDGDILESSQDSGDGANVAASSSTFRLGDDSSNRAYRPFLSFDTSSLPDNAVVAEATIGITRVGNPVGDIPIGVANSEFGDLIVDIASPSFGSSSDLIASDWESSATKLGVSKFAWPAFLDRMTIFSRLEESDNHLVNLTGRTQFRVRYQHDDDNDGVADYMRYASSDHTTAESRPRLTVKYYIPRVDGDFNEDEQLNCADVDALVSAIVAGTDSTLFDLTGDNRVTPADLDEWLAIAGAHHESPTGGNPFLKGDANLDGAVDGPDFLLWNSHKFTSNNGWCGGDFNADGDTDGQDFVTWNNHKFQTADISMSGKGGIHLNFAFDDGHTPRLASLRITVHWSIRPRGDNLSSTQNMELAPTSNMPLSIPLSIHVPEEIGNRPERTDFSDKLRDGANEEAQVDTFFEDFEGEGGLPAITPNGFPS